MTQRLMRESWRRQIRSGTACEAGDSDTTNGPGPGAATATPKSGAGGVTKSVLHALTMLDERLTPPRSTLFALMQHVWPQPSHATAPPHKEKTTANTRMPAAMLVNRMNLDMLGRVPANLPPEKRTGKDQP